LKAPRKIPLIERREANILSGFVTPLESFRRPSSGGARTSRIDWGNPFMDSWLIAILMSGMVEINGINRMIRLELEIRLEALG
jgi:hypothetical protein